MSLSVSSCLHLQQLLLCFTGMTMLAFAVFHWYDYACLFAANCKLTLVKVSIS